MTAEIEIDDGRIRLVGELSFATVPGLLARTPALFATPDRQAPIEIDLEDVTRSDSAGLALLVEWHRLACRQQRPIRFHNVPDQIEAFARVSHLEGLLDGTGERPAPAT